MYRTASGVAAVMQAMARSVGAQRTPAPGGIRRWANLENRASGECSAAGRLVESTLHGQSVSPLLVDLVDKEFADQQGGEAPGCSVAR